MYVSVVSQVALVSYYWMAAATPATGRNTSLTYMLGSVIQCSIDKKTVFNDNCADEG